MPIHFKITDLCALPLEGFNGLKSVFCGDLKVILLSEDIEVSEAMMTDFLHPGERVKAMSFQSLTRREEYIRSRVLIHKLLGDFSELKSDPSGFILWPKNMVGSLSHKDGLIACTLQDLKSAIGLGIDLESVAKVHTGLTTKILKDPEIELIEETLKSAPEGWTFCKLLALAFSFKEAVFKAVFPIGRKFFYFHKFDIKKIALHTGKIEGNLNFDASEVTPKETVLAGDFLFLTHQLREWVLTSVQLKP